MKKLKEFLLASSIAIANVLPTNLNQTNFFYKGDPEIIRVRDACDNEVNVEMEKNIKSGTTILKRGPSLPTIYTYLSKNQREFSRMISSSLNSERNSNNQKISLADSEVIAITKHLISRSKMLRKYRDIKIPEVIELLSCVDKATKIKTNQIPIDFKSQEEVDKLLGKVTRTKNKLFEEPLNESPKSTEKIDQTYYTD